MFGKLPFSFLEDGYAIVTKHTSTLRPSVFLYCTSLSHCPSKGFHSKVLQRCFRYKHTPWGTVGNSVHRLCTSRLKFKLTSFFLRIHLVKAPRSSSSLRAVVIMVLIIYLDLISQPCRAVQLFCVYVGPPRAHLSGKVKGALTCFVPQTEWHSA